MRLDTILLADAKVKNPDLTFDTFVMLCLQTPSEWEQACD